VLLVTILVIIVSLSAVVYAAALTNPGHGVEQVGSGSSPYAPFRDWNALEAGYEDQYSGPAALKSNIFWLATTNAETIAAQNSSGDWCAFQVHPSGIYMNCFNNASNMSLFNSYYWNGTNFTKNDTIKEGNNVVERNIIHVGAGGGFELTEFNSPSGTAGTEITSTSAVLEVVSGSILNPGGTEVSAGTYGIDGGSGLYTFTAQNPATGANTGTSGAGSTGITTISGTPDAIESGQIDIGGAGIDLAVTDQAGTGNPGGNVNIADDITETISAAGIPNIFTTVMDTTGQTTELYDAATGLIQQLGVAFTGNANGGVFTVDVYDVAAGTILDSLTADVTAGGDGNIEITNTDSTTASSNAFTQTFPGGEAQTDITLVDTTGVNTVGETFDVDGGTGAGVMNSQASTWTHSDSSGATIGYPLIITGTALGDAGILIADPSISDMAWLIGATVVPPGLCSFESLTHTPGVGTIVTYMGAGGGPCAAIVTVEVAFAAIPDN